MKKLVKIGFFIAAMLFAVPKIYAQVSVGVSISANIAPPPIPVYVQPPCPIDGYLWQPGYWAYDPDSGGYYWVPGVWIAPPTIGYLWTPCYWGYDGGVYLFHQGYWGPHVGFYGGINYGYGYFGVGFAGGGWSGDRFRYNTAVMHVNRTVIHNTYVDRTVINRNTIVHNRISYNGGRGGVTARPRPQEEQAMRERHVQPTGAQLTHQRAASRDRSQFASVNHGRPSTAAMNRVNGNRFNPQGSRANTHVNTSANNRVRTNMHMNNNAARQRTQQQRMQPQRRAQAQRTQRPQMQQQQVRQQRMQAQRVQQRQPRPQQQRMQAQRIEQPRPQQQRMQQPRMQPQRMPQQQHGNPGRGGGQPHERHG
ncbi:MAG: hypothetical protein JWQ66_1533 [Mucilaginibacter sp.]|nr:hypothetical protein [Mucilaginibacter sp.]